jgi:hypothetical protein
MANEDAIQTMMNARQKPVSMANMVIAPLPRPLAALVINGAVLWPSLSC